VRWVRGFLRGGTTGVLQCWEADERGIAGVLESREMRLPVGKRRCGKWSFPKKRTRRLLRIHVLALPERIATAWRKVFCFFSSEKKTFLDLN
jgi:hypothetical protein